MAGIETIGIVQLQSMVEYWEEQAINAQRALEYAREQKQYWLGKLAVAYDQPD